MSKEIMRRWLAFNVRRKGRIDSPYGTGGRYSYYDQVLYSHDWPVARLLKGAGKDFICLSKSGVHPSNPPDWDSSPRLKMTITVPCIGAYTRFHADVISELDLHERVKWLSHLEAQELIEKAQQQPAANLVVKGNGGRMVVRLTVIERVYNTYSIEFGLKWPEFPNYEKQLYDVIEARRQEYNDPKIVEKRERAAARREGKLAFDDSTE